MLPHCIVYSIKHICIWIFLLKIRNHLFKYNFIGSLKICSLTSSSDVKSSLLIKDEMAKKTSRSKFHQYVAHVAIKEILNNTYILNKPSTSHIYYKIYLILCNCNNKEILNILKYNCLKAELHILSTCISITLNLISPSTWISASPQVPHSNKINKRPTWKVAS